LFSLISSSQSLCTGRRNWPEAVRRRTCQTAPSDDGMVSLMTPMSHCRRFLLSSWIRTTSPMRIGSTRCWCLKWRARSCRYSVCHLFLKWAVSFP
jgi:hypothetical protein